MVKIAFVQVLGIYFHKEIWSQLCFECKNLYMILSVSSLLEMSFTEGPQRAHTSLMSCF